MKHWRKALLGLAVTVLLLWWVLRDESPSEIVANIAQGNFLLLSASIFVATFGFFIRALRWKVLLAPVKADTRLRSRFAGVAIGFMVNNLLPARAGELARPYAFSRLEPVTASAAFGSLVVERFMDGVVLLLFLVVPVMMPGFPAVEALSEGRGATIIRGGVVAVVLVMVGLVVMTVLPRRFVRLSEWFSRFLPGRIAGRAVGMFESFLDSLAIMRDPRLLALGFAWTLFFWTWHGVSFWLGMLAFGIDTGFVSALFTEAVVGFAVALPAAPGFFGTFHAGADFAISTVYGVDGAQSLAFAFGYHFGGWLPITFIGLYYAWALGLSLGDLGSAKEPEDGAGASGDGDFAEAN